MLSILKVLDCVMPFIPLVCIFQVLVTTET